ncbi:MAG: arginine repressor [Phycisphaerae bacterium]|nr:arginine repressor [Phycisphaerae bacterium]
MATKTRRQAAIRRLLEERGPQSRSPVDSQEKLAAMLVSMGLPADQGTLSRDLREMGVLKGPGGYVLPRTPAPGSGQSPAPPTNERGFLDAPLREMLLSAEASGQLVVVRTGPGRAQALALEIDRAALRGILGTVAGDDTIFIACRSGNGALLLAQGLSRRAGLKGAPK